MKCKAKTFVIILILNLLLLSAASIYTISSVEIAYAAYPSDELYYMVGNYSYVDKGQDVCPDSGTSYDYIKESTTNSFRPKFLRIFISNGETTNYNNHYFDPSSQYTGASARYLTITVMAPNSYNQHIVDATLYRGDTQVDHVGKTNLSKGNYVTLFNIEHPSTGEYWVRIKYCVDKGWEIGPPGVGWVGYTFDSAKYSINNNPPSLSGPDNGAIVQSATVTTSYSREIVVDNSNTGSYRYSNFSEGYHTYYSIDDQGNASETRGIYIDKTAPTGTLHGVSVNQATNGSVYFSSSTSSTGVGSTAKCCDSDQIDIKYNFNYSGYQPYSNNQILTAEGYYNILISDKAGNNKTYSFTIDKTAPTGTLSGVINGGITNSNVTFVWNDTNATATLNGKTYTKGSSISEERIHTIVLTDWAGNKTTYSFEIDKTPAIPTIYEENDNVIVDGKITNKNVYFTWNDSRSYAYVSKNNGSYTSYKQNYYIDRRSPSTIYLTKNEAISAITKKENSSIKTTIWDGTGIVYSADTLIAQVGKTCYIYLNRVFFNPNSLTNVKDQTIQSYCQYISKNLITESGSYKIQLTDTAGNTTVRSFVIDKIPPTGKLHGTSDGGITNNSVYLTWDESGVTGVLNHSTVYKNGSAISSDGSYTITLTDAAGNSSSYSFVIDTIPKNPTITTSDGQIIIDGFITNQDAFVTWSYANAQCEVSKNGASFVNYIQDYYVDNRFPETVYLTYDSALNSILNYEKSKITSINAWDGSGTVYSADAILAQIGKSCKQYNDLLFFNDASLSEYVISSSKAHISHITRNLLKEEGQYVIKFTDAAGNITRRSFIIDKTAPTGNLQGLTNKELFLANDEVTFFWEESTATARLDNQVYLSGTPITTEGKHTIVLTDLAGNSTTYTFEIDLSAPIGDLIGLTNDKSFLSNKTVLFSWDEASAYATLDGLPYPSGTAISKEGIHIIVLSDLAGNSTTYTFEIDLTSPEGKLDGLTNSNFNLSNGTVVFSWEDDGSSATVSFNGEKKTLISNGTKFQAEGKYSLVLTDLAGNSTSYSFEIDLTAPTGVLKGLTNTLFNLSNKSVTFVWNESAARATLDGSAYTGELVSTEGKHTIVLTDLAGNSSYYSFEIDLTAPTGLLYLTKGTEWTGTLTNKNVYFSWSESSATATLDGRVLLSGSGTGEEGEHVIVLTDLSGNKRTYIFKIDKTPPLGSLTGLTNDGYLLSNKAVSFSWEETAAFATLDGSNYIKGTKVTTEGIHKIILTDSAGNYSEYTFTIDITPPIAKLIGFKNGEIINSRAAIVWEEPGVIATLNGIIYTSGQAILAEGSYTVVLIDLAGNNTTYNFEIDLTPPIGLLDGVSNNGRTNSNVTFNWSESTASATLNNIPYNRGTAIKAEGEYILILTDVAGNSSSYHWIIDLTPPVGVFGSDSNLVGEINYFAKDLYFTWAEEGAYAECALNDGSFQKYENGSLIDIEGSYKIKLYDSVGNFTQYYFVLDKTPFTRNKDFIMANNVCHINKWFESYSYRLDGEKYIENIRYSFTNYDDALRYAINRERSIIEAHDEYLGGNIFCDYANRYVDGMDVSSTTSMVGQPYYIYKSSDNPSKLIAYFKDSILERAINKYAEKSVYTYYLPNTPSLPYPGDAYIDAQLIFRDQIYIKDTSFILPYKQIDGYLFINGVIADYTKVLNPGLNVIKEIDYAGNETSYTIILDTAPPNFVVEDAVGNILSNYEDLLNSERTEFYFDKPIKLSLLDNYDENSLLTISVDGVTTNVIGNAFECNRSGVYSYIVRDISGNTRKGTIYLSLDVPEISITENLNIKQRLESFDVSIYKKLQFNQIISISVSRQDGEGEFLDVLYDDNGVSIKNTLLNYHFVSNGNYIFTLVDNYYREITLSYSFVKEAPIGTLYTRDGVILPNGSITNKDVYFNWLDPSCTAYYIIDGVQTEYPQKEYISSTGKYTILLKDAGDNTSIYSFEIDKTAPNSGIMYYLDDNNKNVVLVNKAKTNHTVFFTYDKDSEPGATVRYTVDNTDKWIFYDGEPITKDGTYIFELADRAGNIAKYQFTIDTIPPVVTIKTSNNQLLNNNSITNKGVMFVFDEPNVIVYLDKSPYISGTIIREEGTHVLNIEDSCGNLMNYFVTIDMTAPLGDLVGVANGGITNTDISLSWQEDDLLLFINDILADSVTLKKKIFTLSDEGKYSLTLHDRAGNVTSFSFEIDKTPPIGTLSGVLNGGITNKNVSFTWSDGNATATLNGGEYVSKTIIRIEGEFTIVLTDRAGNSTTYTFEIDQTPPEGILTGVENDGRTNKNVSFSWTETDATALLDDFLYESGTLIGSQGSHVLILTDRAGNSTTYSFEIDKTPPEGILTGVTNNGLTNKNVTFSWNENGLVATLNGAPYEANTIIRNEGFYKIILTDRAGNYTVYSFEIDKSAPLGEIKGLTNDKLNLSNNVVIFSWRDTTATATLDGQLYLSESPVDSEGKHIIVLTDIAGNSTTYTFEIDKTAPIGELLGLTNETFKLSNGTVKFNWDELSATATLDNKEYVKGSTITSEGKHTIILTDCAGNSTSFLFEIDKTAPIGKISGLTNLDRNLSNSLVSFSWDETNLYAILDNGSEIYNNFNVSTEGKHTIRLFDLAGNHTSYSFEIDLTAPKGTLKGLTNTLYNLSNNIVTFSWEEGSAVALLDGSSYKSGTSIASEGKHLIVLTDLAGNSITYSFEIDLTSPTYLLFNTDGNIVSGNNFNFSVYFFWDEDNCIAKLNDELYSQNTFIETNGKYKFELTDLAGNCSVTEIIINKLNPVGNFVEQYNYANDIYYFKSTATFIWENANYSAVLNNLPYSSNTIIRGEGIYCLILTDKENNFTVYNFIIDYTSPEGVLQGLTNSEYALSNQSVIFSWTEVSATASLNGESYINGSNIAMEGKHTIILTDLAGNSTIYNFEIDLTKPIALLVGVKENGVTSSMVKISWEEPFLEVTINGKAINNNYTLNLNGDYKLVLTDRAGNSNTYSFRIDKSIPEGTLIGVKNGGITNTDVYLEWENSLISAIVNGEPYESGTILSVEGTYEIILSNEAGITKMYNFIIDKTAPEGELFGLTNEKYNLSNGTVTFYWLDQDVSATLNGSPYSAGESVNKQGKYEIILTDRAGNFTTYSFEIDKTSPDGEFSGLTNDKLNLSNGTVTFSWSEERATATLNNKPYFSNSAITEEGFYTIILKDAAGNTHVYEFEIDKTAPVGTLSGLTNLELSLSNETVTFSWKENGCYAFINNDSDKYTQSITISKEGNYAIKLVDLAGNYKYYNFSIIKTAPEGTLNGITNEKYNLSNSTVSLTWTNSDYFAILDENSYEREQIIKSEGKHRLTLFDAAGNSRIFDFEIDHTAPVGEFSGFTNKEKFLSNKAVSFSWSENLATATLDGKEYLSNTNILSEGVHTLILVDRAGNFTSYVFEIDKTAPIGELSGLTNEKYLLSNQPVKLTWEEKTASCTLNNEPYHCGIEIFSEGDYTFILTDEAGNKTVFEFKIDLTAPEANIENNFVTNKSIKITWNESSATGSLIFNEIEKLYEQNTTIRENGKYLFVLTDLAGNKNLYNFEINTIPPSSSVITKDGIITAIEDGKNFNISQGFLIPEGDYTVYINGDIYEPGTLIEVAGRYDIEIINSLGNKTTFSVRLTPEIEKVETKNDAVNYILYVMLGGLALALIIKTIVSKTKKKQKLSR